MDDHSQSGLKTNSPVQVTVLSETDVKSPGRVTQYSNESLELVAKTPASPGAAVKIEGDDVLFLGEVSSCRTQGDSFVLNVELQHAIYNTRELARLAKRLLDEAERL